MTGIVYPLPPKGVPLYRITKLKPNFNWGAPQDNNRLTWSPESAVSVLAGARLTELDVAAIKGLRLGSEFDDRTRDDFARLMDQLDRYLVKADGTTVEGVMAVWLAELLTYLPPFCFDSEADDLIKEQVVADAAGRYLDRGFGAPLTALYLLTLRSNYWQEQFHGYSGGHELIDSVLERKPLESCGHTFAEILGDPFTSPSTKDWTPEQRSDFFLVREDFVYTYLSVDQADGHREDLRAITEAMLLLASVAGQYIGGRLKMYIKDYESWLNEYVMAENGYQLPPHMS